MILLRKYLIRIPGTVAPLFVMYRITGYYKTGGLSYISLCGATCGDSNNSQFNFLKLAEVKNLRLCYQLLCSNISLVDPNMGTAEMTLVKIVILISSISISISKCIVPTDVIFFFT